MLGVGEPDWFAHTLALALGMTVREAKRRITAREWRAWREYYRRYPWDDLTRYHRGPAMLASLISAALGRKASMRDYMPWSASSASEMPYDAIEQMMMAESRDA